MLTWPEVCHCYGCVIKIEDRRRALEIDIGLKKNCRLKLLGWYYDSRRCRWYEVYVEKYETRIENFCRILQKTKRNGPIIVRVWRKLVFSRHCRSSGCAFFHIIVSESTPCVFLTFSAADTRICRFVLRRTVFFSLPNFSKTRGSEIGEKWNWFVLQIKFLSFGKKERVVREKILNR